MTTNTAGTGDALDVGQPADNSKLHVQHWVVGFFDLLGQRDALRKMDFLPEQDDREKVAALMEAVRGSVGVITKFHEMFTQFRDGATKPPDHDVVGSMTPEQRQLFDNLRRTRIDHADLSDGMMAYSSLVPSSEHSPVRACYEMVCAAGAAMLTTLAWGHPMRGGIDVGTGIEVEPGQLHGPALVKAYELESRVAEFPRVVVGSTLSDYLRVVAGRRGDLVDTINAQIAASTRTLFRQDGDGQIIVDYMGDSFKKHIAANIDQKIVHQARQFAVGQLAHFEKIEDEKLRGRYERLVAYFDSRAHVWL
jgi:hypothetical protein